MLDIKILGPGCFNCLAVEEAVILSLERLSEQYPDLEVTLQHVQDMDEIFQYPIFFTPGLVINEKVVCAGRIPTVDEVLKWLTASIQETA
jgi:small redox-active disulfide protein 2